MGNVESGALKLMTCADDVYGYVCFQNVKTIYNNVHIYEIKYQILCFFLLHHHYLYFWSKFVFKYVYHQQTR